MTDENIIAAARQLLTTEADALAALSRTLPDDFAAAVTAIKASEGQVVVAGVGKSGHIGRKIAATLASTGTPAIFVHPTEASHGDLGMIRAQDICLLISNSGETSELGDLLAYCRRFDIPMIGLSSRPDSTLMQAATYRLTLPQMPEACPMGLAPTTSTTMTLALGDALAVALMEVRGFTAEIFSVFHPGGKLGAQLARVRQLMHDGEDLPVVSAQTPMSDALIEMTSKGFGVAAVVAPDGSLTGVVTDGDLRRNMDGLLDRKAGDVATKSPVTVAPDMLAAEAMAILQKHRISALIVTDGGTPLGVLHLHDLLRAGVA
ncbi:KpsF/GutQ family sugar-phosphate isomerase [Palleronia caenipelagi]|uniref:KpsF/GutQ family sugar-phosphate isomerase n=1 Tax=Palleronia caenipelagi TaxID=2489174 RepID=A0A547PRA0_9RHOB|nr:KpsF/GutQ family sugar-phosphate isomerase [Palleronia caenipelagi]TRD16667.1 KpsF/GutQ family sugar-phosphate isomerase [Palleronia caenipelagi]